MAILVTGAAGFIGYHVSKALMDSGHDVIGVDNVNHYYRPALKQARLKILESPRFTFIQKDVSIETLKDTLKETPLDAIIHLAAYAGVRYSLERPDLYLETNILGQLKILELARQYSMPPPIIYASSSSVYGMAAPPFDEERQDIQPLSPYAVSKRSAELLSDSYAALYGLKITGLRFFTVYGPWGRPDMAYFKFTEAILQNKAIDIFGDGTMKRDFTYIDDIVTGILGALNRKDGGHRLYNLGNDHPESVNALIQAIEEAIGRQAICRYGQEKSGEVPITWADITRARNELGFAPKTSLQEGITLFTRWYISQGFC